MKVLKEQLVTVAVMTTKGISQAQAPQAQTFSPDVRHTRLRRRLESAAVDGGVSSGVQPESLAGRWLEIANSICNNIRPAQIVGRVGKKCIESMVPAG